MHRSWIRAFTEHNLAMANCIFSSIQTSKVFLCVWGGGGREGKGREKGGERVGEGRGGGMSSETPNLKARWLVGIFFVVVVVVPVPLLL